jgi:peptidyl-prolyl cis-trans isomerase SurA
MTHLKKIILRFINKFMMKRDLKFVIILVGLLLSGTFNAKSQVLVESVTAIVGNEVIYLSDVETMITDIRREGNRQSADQLRCSVLERLLVNKLFLDQARIDSIIVTEDVVEGNLNMRINDAIRQAGSEKALEDYFKKSMIEIRRDIRKTMLEQGTINEVQGTIAQNITVTPAALKRFYASIPKDSLPLVPAKVQLSILQLDPPSNEDNKAAARQKLLDIRSEILAGKSFDVLARLYSEDPEAAKAGGEIGFFTRGELEKEYADAAFSLTKNTVSKIVETKHGFHIIQLIERKGDMVNTRHILIKPKVLAEQATRAMNRLDSIADLIRSDSIKFEVAARMLSTHKDSRVNGGKFVSTNPSDRVTWFTLEELNPEMYIKVREMKVGEISEPFRTTDDDGNVVFRIVKLDKELPAHRVNLKDDYQDLYNAALSTERSKTYENWIKKKIETTYVKISEEVKSCEFLQKEWLN